MPHKYWTSRDEPISPIVLSYKRKSPAKNPILPKQKKNEDLARTHLDVYNTEFSFLEHNRNSVPSEQVTDLVDGGNASI